MLSGKPFLCVIFVSLNTAWGWVHPTGCLKVASASLYGTKGDEPTETPRYITDPYTDPVTGKTMVDVTDLGVTMGDLGNNGWADAGKVHPAPGEPGLSGQDFVTMTGDIDWDAMAKALQKES